MAQPLRRQVFLSVSILTVLVYLAIGYGAKLTYDEHVRQLAAETATMAATVVVYVNRNLETADAVAATASRHPAMRTLDPQAALEVLQPLLGGRDELLHNALIADTNGRPVAWAAPPDEKVEGRLDPAFLKSVATTGKTLMSPMLDPPALPGPPSIQRSDSNHADPEAEPGCRIIGKRGPAGQPARDGSAHPVN